MTERPKWYKYLQLVLNPQDQVSSNSFPFLGRLLLAFSSSTEWCIFRNKIVSNINAGHEIYFFSERHLAPKFFKVVPNSKKFKPFLYAVSILDRTSKMKLGKRSFMCHKVDSRMDDIQPLSSPKSKMVSSQRLRCMCCVLETNLKRKFAAYLLLQIFLAHYIFR